MALFTAVDKAKWKSKEWDKLFNLMNDFKNEFSLDVSSITSLRGSRISFSFGDFHVYVEDNMQGFWITLEGSTSKVDFDEKYKFIFSRLTEV